MLDVRDNINKKWSCTRCKTLVESRESIIQNRCEHCDEPFFDVSPMWQIFYTITAPIMLLWYIVVYFIKKRNVDHT